MPEADRAELEKGLEELERAIAGLRGKPAARYLPDIQIYHTAVRTALQHNEFFAPGDIGKAKRLLQVGLERARVAADGQTSWVMQPGYG